jgi:hypothetical protein
LLAKSADLERRCKADAAVLAPIYSRLSRAQKAIEVEDVPTAREILKEAANLLTSLKAKIPRRKSPKRRLNS